MTPLLYPLRCQSVHAIGRFVFNNKPAESGSAPSQEEVQSGAEKPAETSAVSAETSAASPGQDELITAAELVYRGRSPSYGGRRLSGEAIRYSNMPDWQETLKWETLLRSRGYIAIPSSERLNTARLRVNPNRIQVTAQVRTKVSQTLQSMVQIGLKNSTWVMEEGRIADYLDHIPKRKTDFPNLVRSLGDVTLVETGVRLNFRSDTRFGEMYPSELLEQILEENGQPKSDAMREAILRDPAWRAYIKVFEQYAKAWHQLEREEADPLVTTPEAVASLVNDKKEKVPVEVYIQKYVQYDYTDQQMYMPVLKTLAADYYRRHGRELIKDLEGEDKGGGVPEDSKPRQLLQEALVKARDLLQKIGGLRTRYAKAKKTIVESNQNVNAKGEARSVDQSEGAQIKKNIAEANSKMSEAEEEYMKVAPELISFLEINKQAGKFLDAILGQFDGGESGREDKLKRFQTLLGSIDSEDALPSSSILSMLKIITDRLETIQNYDSGQERKVTKLQSGMKMEEFMREVTKQFVKTRDAKLGITYNDRELQERAIGELHSLVQENKITDELGEDKVRRYVNKENRTLLQHSGHVLKKRFGSLGLLLGGRPNEESVSMSLFMNKTMEDTGILVRRDAEGNPAFFNTITKRKLSNPLLFRRAHTRDWKGLLDLTEAAPTIKIIELLERGELTRKQAYQICFRITRRDDAVESFDPSKSAQMYQLAENIYRAISDTAITMAKASVRNASDPKQYSELLQKSLTAEEDNRKNWDREFASTHLAFQQKLIDSTMRAGFFKKFLWGKVVKGGLVGGSKKLGKAVVSGTRSVGSSVVRKVRKVGEVPISEQEKKAA